MMRCTISGLLCKKTVVEGILARVCLTRAGYPTNGGKPYYEKAAVYAKSVKDAQKHDLNPDVYEMWKRMASDRYDTEYNESMWEVEFIGARDLDGNWTDGRIGNVIGNLQKRFYRRVGIQLRVLLRIIDPLGSFRQQR